MNRTTLILIILICAVLLGTGAIWYVYTKPMAITAYVSLSGGKPPIPDVLTPTTTPIQPPLDPLPWGTRLGSKEMPHVEGVIWKTYVNKEYGFEMQYPEGWRIDSHIDNVGRENMEVDRIIFFSFDPPGATYDNLPIALLHTNVGLMKYLEHYYGGLSDGYSGPVKKNIIINNVNWLVEDPDEYHMQGDLYAEKGDYIYRFGGTSFPTRNERNIIEYIVKSFRFLK